jgi:2-dehydropantoate 2-reductase
VAEDLANVRECAVIIIAVKTGATKLVGEQLAKILPLRSSATIVSFQNGTRNAQVLREELKERTNIEVLSAMINFNADWDLKSNQFNKNTDGGVKIERPVLSIDHESRIETLAQALSDGQLPSIVVTNIEGVMYSKLLINLFNAINALSGLSTPSTMVQMGYRQIWAAAIAEGLAVYQSNGIVPASFRGLPPDLIPHILVLPDWLFWFVIYRVATMDDRSKSSMLQDLERGRTITEVDELCGEIVRLGGEGATSSGAPVNAALARLVKSAVGSADKG